MTKKALYPGSFDPITNGHIDIVKRASQIFDEVTIAVFDNPKKTALFSFEERKELMREVFKDSPKVQIHSFGGLLVEYAKQQEIYTIIRGLRAVSDFDYEFQLALMNRQIDKEVDSLFFMTDEKYSYLSSSLVRQVSQYGGDVSAFVPPVIAEALKRKQS